MRSSLHSSKEGKPTTCLEFHRDPYKDSKRTCTLSITNDELKVICNALHYYCEDQGKDEVEAHEIHRELYGIKSFIDSGVNYDDGVLTVLDQAIKDCKEREKERLDQAVKKVKKIYAKS
jgi:hypothetical protein